MRRLPRPGRSARRRTASATTSPPPGGYLLTSRRSTSARGSWPTATRWRISRRGMPTIPRRRPSTRWRWRPATIRRTRPTRACSKPARSSSGSHRTQPDHPGFVHYIIHAYDVPPLAPKAVECRAQLRQDRAVGARTRCTCRRTRSPVSATGRIPIDTNIASAQAARREKVRPAKSCTRWTIRRMPICRWRRIARRGGLVDALPEVISSHSIPAAAAPPRPRSAGGVRACGDSRALRARTPGVG